ncbi:MAG: tRNA (guanosine(37)-N1)-methyltransferase TrmD [Chloroflexi bacterium]|nr:tRNA (guanosine(37)-N1)-methyltransferase TrmD [Chloroflexota bacterium]
MRFDVLTTFPEMIRCSTGISVIGRARERGLIDVRTWDIRDFATDRHRTTDEPPYGGGAGMVMRPEPIFAAVEAALADSTAARADHRRVILLAAQGQRFTHQRAREYVRADQIVLICGRYEGVDERVREHLATDTLSIGDYVLTGGEIAALAVIDATARLLPGVLGSPESTVEESFAAGLLEYPHYTRPQSFRGWNVPAILLSGDHGAIARWRRERSIERTMMERPDLLESAVLSETDRRFLDTTRQRLGSFGSPGDP